MVETLLDEDVQERVAAGIDALGRKRNLVNKRTLDIADFSKCVGGQLAAAKPPIDLFTEVIDCDARKGVELGFDLAPGEVSAENYGALTQAWKDAL